VLSTQPEKAGGKATQTDETLRTKFNTFLEQDRLSVESWKVRGA